MAEPRRIVLATRNRGKLRELAKLLEGVDVVLLTADEVDAPDVEETGATFEENAELKATEIARACGLLAIADDSGLEVPDLGGEPGVRSARYSPEGTDAANNRKLRAEMGRLGLTRPLARFVCAMCLADPDGVVATVRGEVEGNLLAEPRGENGFGYDPLFFQADLGKTFAEASAEEKHGVSHRGKALRKLVEHLMARIVDA